MKNHICVVVFEISRQCRQIVPTPCGSILQPPRASQVPYEATKNRRCSIYFPITPDQPPQWTVCSSSKTAPKCKTLQHLRHGSAEHRPGLLWAPATPRCPFTGVSLLNPFFRGMPPRLRSNRALFSGGVAPHRRSSSGVHDGSS